MSNKLIKHSDIELLRGNPELMHFGILGMKWGVRRTPEQLGNGPKKKRVGILERKRQEKEAIRARKIQEMQDSMDRYAKEREVALSKGAETRKNNQDISKLDKSGRLNKDFYDFTSSPLPKLPLKEIDDMLELEYKNFEKEGFPLPKGPDRIKKDTYLHSVIDNMLTFHSRSDSFYGHELDVEYDIMPDGKVKILGVVMNG